MASQMSPLNIDNDPTEWTDEEIREFLKVRNISIPLTSTTKPLILQKIRKLLNHVAIGAEENGRDIAVECSTEPHSTSQSEADPTCYYGVAVGGTTENGAIEPISPYYSNKEDIRKLSERRKDLRFKKFSTKAEAVQFSRTDVSVPLHSSCNLPLIAEEKANSFSEPRQPLLNKFKAVIESGDVEKFAECVWENPRLAMLLT